MDEQTGRLNDLLDRFETLFETFAQQQAAALQQQLDAFHVENACMTEAYFEAIAKKEHNIPEKADVTLSLPSEEVSPVVERPDDEKSTSGKTIVDESVGIEQNKHVDFNGGRSLNLVVAANDVGNNGFSAMDHQWQGDFFATGGVVQVDTWNHNRSQPVNIFEWGSGLVRCNLREPNIVATYDNDMGFTNYGPRLKDEAIKKLKERTQMSKKRLKIWDPGIKIFLDDTLRARWFRRSEECYALNYYSEDQYAVSIKEDTAYPCLHSPKTTENKAQYAANKDLMRMDDPNMTMEEYTKFEEEKARRRGRVFKWQTATYGKVKVDDDLYDLRSVEAEFPAIVIDDTVTPQDALQCKSQVKNDNEKAGIPSFPPPKPTTNYIDDLDFFNDFENEFPSIVYNDAQTSKSDLLTKPILNPQHIDKFNLNDETSMSEYDEEEQNILYFNDLFPFNIIRSDDLKSEKDNNIDIMQSFEAIQEMAEYSQKWHNGTSRGRSTKTSDGLAAIQKNTAQ
ncbi:hypothetical protein Tco_0994015 [Tanacetum coccineum]